MPIWSKGQIRICSSLQQHLHALMVTSFCCQSECSAPLLCWVDTVHLNIPIKKSVQKFHKAFFTYGADEGRAWAVCQDRCIRFCTYLQDKLEAFGMALWLVQTVESDRFAAAVYNWNIREIGDKGLGFVQCMHTHTHIYIHTLTHKLTH